MTTTQNLTLIDADSLLYTIAGVAKGKEVKNPDGTVSYTYSKTDKRKIIMKTQTVVNAVLRDTEADYYMGFYQSLDKGKSKEEHNFRYALYPDYKGNRGEALYFIEHWKETIMEVFRDKFKFVAVSGFESDDAVCFMYHHYKDQFNVTIAANDKDTLQHAGTFYYDLSKKIFGVPNALKGGAKSDKPDFLPRGTKRKITQFEAALHTALQMIIGDGADKIKGAPGAGPAKAVKVLTPCKSILEIKKAVVQVYYDAYEARRKSISRKAYTLSPEEEEFARETYTTKDTYDRYVRILKKNHVQKQLDEEFGGMSLNDYIRVQWKLIVMLKDVPEGFDTTIHKGPGRAEDEDVQDVEDNLLCI